jgi:hypothetical protein
MLLQIRCPNIDTPTLILVQHTPKDTLANALLPSLCTSKPQAPIHLLACRFIVDICPLQAIAIGTAAVLIARAVRAQ